MLIALRDLPIGDKVLKAGEPLTAELAKLLPQGRVEQLRNQRHLIEQGDSLEARIDDLEARVKALEKKPRATRGKAA